MQYLVVDSNGLDGFDSKCRHYNFADSYSREVQRALTPSRTVRHARATSVGFPAREVEIVRRPLYDSMSSEQNLYYTPSRHASRAASVAFGVEPAHYHHRSSGASRIRGAVYRESTPMSSSTVMQSNGEPWPGASYSRHRHRCSSAVGPAGNVYRPSMWCIGTAGFQDGSNERSRRMQSRLEGLLNYEPPPADYYLSMKQRLRAVNEHMLQHRQLIDRYAAVDSTPMKSVEEGIQDRYYELVERMPQLERGHTRRPVAAATEDHSYGSSNYQRHDRATTPSVNFSSGSETSAVRGKIRKLLSKTKHSG